MLRRASTFLTLTALVGAVGFLVYFNSQEITFKITPAHEYSLPLGWLILTCAGTGGLAVFLILVLREGRWALRQWRVQREKRRNERDAQSRSDSRTLILAGEYDKARRLLQRSAKHGEPAVGDQLDIVDTYLAQDDYAQARQAAEDGLRQFGQEPLLLHKLATACHGLGDHAAAERALTRALSTHPASLPMLSLLRDTLVKSGTWDRAATAQKRLVECNPNDTAAKQRLLELRLNAAAAANENDREAALRAIIGQDPGYVPAITALAGLLNDNGDRRGASKLLEKALKRHVDAALLDTMEIITPVDERAGLLKFYTKLAAKSQPAQADDLRLRMAQHLLAADRAEDAASQLQLLVAAGEEPAAQRVWGQIYHHQGRQEEALRAFRRAYPATTGHVS